MQTLNIKVTHKSVKDYYEQLSKLSELRASHEGAVSPVFAALLQHCANQFKQTLVEQYHLRNGNRVDGAIVDTFNLVHGYWEAKDTADDLDEEIKKKFEIGYPKNNILFQAPNRIVIYQDNQQIFDEDITNPEHLIEGLKLFFEYEQPAFEQWKGPLRSLNIKSKN